MSIDNLTFEQALLELDRVVQELEEGNIGLEEALARYERGVQLLRRCYGMLQQAEKRVVLLTGIDGKGNPITEPFETVEDPTNATSTRRRPIQREQLFD
jgi:exodeoxyribonuclease VII small subunit